MVMRSLFRSLIATAVGLSFFGKASSSFAAATTAKSLKSAAKSSKSTTGTTGGSVSTMPLSEAATEKPAEDEDKSTYKGSVKLQFYGRNITDNYVNAKAGWLVIVPSLEAQYTKWLSLNASVLFLMGEGAGQNYYNDEGATANAIAIDELALTIKPFEFLSLKAGALEGALNPLMSVMTPGTFIGTVQRMDFANEKETVKFTLQANEQMPGEGVKTGGVVDQKKNPFFLAGMAQLDLKAEPIGTTLKLAATRFQFGNLSNATAKSSLVKGNSPMSITGQGDAAEFLIGFSGVEAGAALETEWNNKVTTILKGIAIQNEKAPEDRNKGQMGSFAIKYKKGNITWTPSLMVFNVQADVTPAAYSITSMRYHNRKGQKAELKIDMEKQKLTFFGNYTKSDELVANPYLADREIINLGVEAKYDLF